MKSIRRRLRINLFLGSSLILTQTAMLALARADNGHQLVHLEVLNLRALLETTWKRAAHKARERKILWQSSLQEKQLVRSDRIMLTQILQNLITNMVLYAPPGSTLRLDHQTRGERLTLNLTNQAPDLDQQDLEPIFHRFWRKDPARTGGQNSGLGLSLVKVFCQLLQIPLAVSLNQQTFCLSLGLPLCKEGQQQT